MEILLNFIFELLKNKQLLHFEHKLIMLSTYNFRRLFQVDFLGDNIKGLQVTDECTDSSSGKPI